jgi:hypothetical protein
MVLINFLAFCSLRVLKVFGATIKEKKILLPIRIGIKKSFIKIENLIICSIMNFK